MQTPAPSPPPHPSRRIRAVLAFAGALACAGLTHAYARAREDAPPHAYGVQMQLAVHGQASSPLLTVEENKPFAVAVDNGGKPVRAEFVLNRTREPGTVRVAGKIIEGGATLSEPVLVGKLGERMGVQVGDEVKLALVVKDLAP